METIKVFKGRKGLARFFIAFGIIFTLFGSTLLVIAISNGFDLKILNGDWNSILFTIQGIMFTIVGISSLNSKKYYIEWDDTTLRYYLPGSKIVQTVNFSDIISIYIRLFEIEIKMEDSVRILKLDNLQFEDIRKIKNKFESFTPAR